MERLTEIDKPTTNIFDSVSIIEHIKHNATVLNLTVGKFCLIKVDSFTMSVARENIRLANRIKELESKKWWQF